MIFIFLVLFSSLSFAQHDHGGGNASIGKGKGVEYYDEHDGFILSKEAIKRLGIIASDIGSQKDCSLKSAQIISALDRKLIYIKSTDKFKSVSVTCASVKAGDLVVTKGALRILHLAK